MKTAQLTFFKKPFSYLLPLCDIKSRVYSRPCRHISFKFAPVNICIFVRHLCDTHCWLILSHVASIQVKSFFYLPSPTLHSIVSLDETFLFHLFLPAMTDNNRPCENQRLFQLYFRLLLLIDLI